MIAYYLQDIHTRFSGEEDGIHLMEITTKALNILRTNRKLKSIEVWKVIKALDYKVDIFHGLDGEDRQKFYSLNLSAWQYLEMTDFALHILRGLTRVG